MSDTVSRELFAQIKWERDMAVQQLKDLGYAFGEKPRTHYAEPKKGKWVDRDYLPNRARCSECGYGDEFIYEYNFCPNCGADMRREE